MSKRLIVNADDFGFTRDVNEGIVEAHRNGILTATTLMANGDAFDDAVRLGRENATLDIGCHLVLVQGRSVFDPSRELPATLKGLGKALLRGDLPVYKEAVAQIRKLKRAGIQPTHIDTHKHAHLFPPVLDTVGQVAREFGIPWVRCPMDFAVEPGAETFKSALSVGMRILRPRFRSALAGLRMTDHFAGFQITGSFNEANLLSLLRRLPDGLTELMCHPGKLGAELQGAATRLKGTRQTELTALTSTTVRSAIGQLEIELCNYRV